MPEPLESLFYLWAASLLHSYPYWPVMTLAVVISARVFGLWATLLVMFVLPLALGAPSVLRNGPF
jgi:hypothetical protein